MTASLVVAGYEMIGGTTNPEYRLAPGFDFGAGEPDQTTIASLYLDGDAISGERTRNRTISLPVTVRGTGPSDIAGKVTTLLQAVSARTFTMQWTPDGGLPLIFDCYRATWSRPDRSLIRDAQGLTSVVLTFQARPFGRSPDVQSVTVGATLQVDSFDTAPTGATLNTTTHYEGTGSAQLTFPAPSLASTPAQRTFAAKDLSAFANVGVRLYTPGVTSGLVTVAPKGNVIASVTLSSAGGSTRYTTAPVTLEKARWGVAYAPFTGGTVASGSGVNLAAVTGYVLSVVVTQTDMRTSYVLVDDLRATGTAATIIGPTSHSSVLAVPVSCGSARTPVSLTLNNGSSFAAFLLHSPPEDQDSNAAILSSLSNVSTNQTVTIGALNGNLVGTYTVILGVDVVGGGSVTPTVTITQQANGTNIGTATVLTKTYTSGPHLIRVGQVTLPLFDVPDDNSTTGFTVQVQISGADRYTEVMFLDSRGQTISTDADLTSNAVNVYVDEPSPLQSAPAVYGGGARTVAYSLLSTCVMSGGPVIFEAGSNKILAWVSTSTPAVSATYYPRWIDERVS